MLNRTARRIARVARVVADGIRSTVAPAHLVRSTAPELVADPADLLTPAEAEALADEIEAAAASYATACYEVRAGDRGKRKARRLLDRVPAGMYRGWTVERVASSRQTPDLTAIRETYKRLGLGDVPMRDCAPSLRLTASVAADVLAFPAAKPAAPALAA